MARARVDQLAQLARLDPVDARRRLEAAGLRGIGDSSRLDSAALANKIPVDEALLALFAAPDGAKPR